MAELQPTDEFLVNRSDTTYTQETDTLMASLETTDYLLVNRSDATYKITGEDFINSVIDPLEVTVIIAPNPPLIRENAEAIPVVTGGKKPDGGYVFTYQWHYADDLLGTNKVDIPGQTASTYVVPESDITKFIGCTVTTTDALNTTASGTGYGGPVSAVEIAPVIDEVILTEIYDGENRFTDKEFPYTTVMGLDGTPDPTFAVKARLSGTTFNFGVESDTITKVEGGGENVYTTDTIASVSGIPTTYEYGQYVGTVSIDSGSVTWGVATDKQTVTYGDTPTGAQPTYQLINFGEPRTLVYSTTSTGLQYVGFWKSNDGNTWTFDVSYPTGTQGIVGASTVAAQYWLITKDLSQANVEDVSFVPSSAPIFNNSVWKLSDVVPITLTFPTNNNFDKFEVGDVVQAGDVYSQSGLFTGTSDSTWNNWANFFKYKTSPGVDNLGVAVMDGELIWEYPAGLPVSGTTTLWLTPSSGTLFVTGQDGIEKAVPTPGSGNIKIDITSFIGNTLYKFRYGAPGGWAYMYGLEVNGALIVDGLNKNASITAIDNTVPSITVDGGNWAGTDETAPVTLTELRWNRATEW